ncbi:Nuclear pore complex protein NUP1 [Rhynchospora pubera]|uniref:Nuclear pore complex protein NUP1 n=1 Tax=Rhynchospora pubera TaxID=906938 RepID=A0AAV8G329_9POAL|nr:Nuclear pore complex protein NUP1 [Rhynchospora pubera]KAJ4800119.1 Nuclear pore complex protein NUP1 [Rhynchospora pubera]
MASTDPYEGGGRIGGKMTRRAARSQATPYDRPPTALRTPAAVPPPIDGSNGWLSKLVDPASRFISGSASKLFSSVFRKSLTAPPPAPASSSSLPEEMHHDGHEEQVPELTIATNQLAEALVQTTADATQQKKQRDGRDPAGTTSEVKTVSEIEELLVQKTLTKEQFEHLSELLRARIVEPSLSKPTQTSKGKEVEANIPHREYVAESSRKNVMFATPASTVLIPKEEVASPMELAKAYMSSKSSKVSPTTLRLRTPTYIERKPAMANSTVLHPSTKPPTSASIMSRPDSILFNQARDTYPTPRSLGRTAISRMCRSPFVKSGGPSSGGYGAKFSPYDAPTGSTPGSKLALKRGSSALYDDIGSVGPIRRIRQKLNMTTPLKEPTPSPYKNFAPTHTSALKINSNHATTSTQKHLQLTELNQGNDESSHKGGMDETETGNISIPSVPPRSTETAMKIFDQLEKIVHSPKVKENATPVLQIEASSSQKQDKLKVDLSKRTKSDGIISLQNNGFVSMTSAKAGKSVSDGTLGSVVVPKVTKPAFRMSAPEELPDDDDDEETNDKVEATVPVRNVFHKVESSTSKQRNTESNIPEKKGITSETKAAPESLFNISSTSEPDKGVLSAPAVSETNNVFKFASPATTTPTIKSNVPPVPAMPTAPLDLSAKKDDKSPGPVLGIGLKQQEKPETPVFSWASGNTGTKADSRLPATEASDSDRSGQKRKSEDANKATDSADFLASSPAKPVFTFGGSASPSLSNGSTHSSPPKFSSSAVPAVTPVSQLAPASSTPVSASTTTCANVSTPAHEIPNASFFQFGASNAANIQTPASPVLGDSSAKATDINPVKPVAFGSSPIFSGTSSAGSTTAAVQTTAAPSTTTTPSTTGLLSSTMAGQSSSATTNTPTFVFGNSEKTTSPTFTFGSSATTGSATTSLPSFVTAGTTAPVSTATTATTSTTTTAPTVTFASSGSTGGFSFGASSQPANSSSQAAPAQFAFGAAAPSSNSGNSIFGLGASSSQNITSASMPSSSSSLSSLGFGASTGPFFGTKPVQPETNGTQSNPQQSQSLSSQFSSPFSSPASAPVVFGATSGGFPFTSAVSSSSSTSSTSSQPSPFGSGSTITPSVFGTTSFNSNPSGGAFSFNTQPSSTPSSSFTFNTQSSSPGFSFTAGSNNSTALGFGLSNPSTNSSTVFGSVSPGTNNDQMSMEDSMVDDTNQVGASNPLVPVFGQPANPVPLFGGLTGAAPAPAFQFGAQPSQSLFQPGSNLEFNAGNQISGSGASDKANRRIVKINRNKTRRK